MGLGADKSKMLQAKGNTKTKDDKNEEDLEWKTDSYCIVELGKHEGLYGQVMSNLPLAKCKTTPLKFWFIVVQ